MSGVANNTKSTPTTGEKKFENRNLNNAMTKPLSRPSAGSVNRGAFQVMAGSIKRIGKSVGSAAAPVAAPVPMNTPSLRRENGGKDVTINLVPVSSGNNAAVWGGPAEAPKIGGYEAVAGITIPPTSPGPPPSISTTLPNRKTAPWGKADESANGTSAASVKKNL